MLAASGDNEMPSTLARSAAAADEAAGYVPPRIKVLVVEDDAGDLALVERALAHLSRFEPQVTCVSRLVAARFCLAADDFDVVLADLGLGPDCGLDLIEGSPCPVVVMSGSLTPELTCAAMERGAAAAVAKCDLDELLLQHILSRLLLDRPDDTAAAIAADISSFAVQPARVPELELSA